MRMAVGIYLLIHGFCHLVGFVVPWKLISMKDEPYRTTLLAGAIDVGDVGIRIVGLLWLVAALAFVLDGVGAFSSFAMWRPLAFWLALFSLVLCVLGLPGAKVGILANAVVLLYLLCIRLGWSS
jgi:hypothetical protein